MPCTFQVVTNLSVPALRGCDFLDAHVHAILPSDQAVRWRDGTASAIVRGSDDQLDRRASASRVLQVAYKTQLAPRSATLAWVRIPWGGLGQVFGSSRLMKMHRATVANGVFAILPDIAFPVVISSFEDWEVLLRPKTAVGRVYVLATGVITFPSPAARGRAGLIGSTSLRTTPRSALTPRLAWARWPQRRQAVRAHCVRCRGTRTLARRGTSRRAASRE